MSRTSSDTYRRAGGSLERLGTATDGEGRRLELWFKDRARVFVAEATRPGSRLAPVLLFSREATTRAEAILALTEFLQSREWSFRFD